MCSYLASVLFDTSELHTCYYFCNSHDPGHVPHQILRTICLQLLRKNLDLASLISNEYVYRGVNCGLAQLRVLVPQLIELMPRTRIIIDGLDECSLEYQRSALKELQTTCLGAEHRCKLLIASRREVAISEKLSSKPQINLDGRNEVNTDIRSFVRYKTTKLRSSNTDLLKRVESVLVEKANGNSGAFHEYNTRLTSN